VQFRCQKPFEIIQIDRVELPKTLHPDRCAAQGIRVQLAPDHPAPSFTGDEARIGEDGQVFGYGGEGHGEGVGHVSNGHVILQQHGQDGTTRGVGEGGEGGVEGGGHDEMMRKSGEMVNWMVEYEVMPPRLINPDLL
jgi:hypothetical protein